jgi:hypothetical protein
LNRGSDPSNTFPWLRSASVAIQVKSGIHQVVQVSEGRFNEIEVIRSGSSPQKEGVSRRKKPQGGLLMDLYLCFSHIETGFDQLKCQIGGALVRSDFGHGIEE